MKLNRKLTLILAVVLSVAMAVGGTMAYLQDTDEDVNVMTLGNVYIDQIEKERIEQSDDNTSSENVKDFEDDKPLYPYVGKLDWADEYQNWETGGSNQLFTDEVKNVVDKFVFVENTGNSDAYVRTWFAFEQGDYTEAELDKLLGININKTYWAFETVANNVEIEGGKYQIVVATYLGNVGEDKSEHPNGMLPAGETTRPSLLQVYLDKTAGNEEVENLDSNGNGKYDILVVSQAVQAAGFADAETALNAAFTNGAEPVNFALYETEAKGWFKKATEKQAAEELGEHWDGTVDTSWYNDTDTEFVLTTAEQLAGFGKLVDEGNTFEGKTVKLGVDMCLGGCDDPSHKYTEDEEPVSFDPIGYGYNVVFKGTFDGQNHTINNLYQNGWALGLDYSTEGGGLFASVVDATIMNLTIKDPEIVMECIDMGALVGYSYGTSTYKNITIDGGVVANYNRYTGGVVGEVNGTQTFENVDVIDTKISALWGTYDCACGGIIGGKWGDATVIMKDCDVTAELDVFNDACSNYQYYLYRRCGMLIGNSEEVTDGTATASYLTATNCNVTYGDWANYTYCESEAYGKGSYAAEDEWKFKRVQEGYATEGVDPEHTHDTDESHEELLVLDQLFGGDQGVKGGTTHPGVTVVYNNK